MKIDNEIDLYHFANEDLSCTVEIIDGNFCVTMGEYFHEIPWSAIREAIEWKNIQPLEGRSDIKYCEKCNHHIRLADYERHLKAHGL